MAKNKLSNKNNSPLCVKTFNLEGNSPNFLALNKKTKGTLSAHYSVTSIPNKLDFKKYIASKGENQSIYSRDKLIIYNSYKTLLNIIFYSLIIAAIRYPRVNPLFLNQAVIPFSQRQAVFTKLIISNLFALSKSIIPYLVGNLYAISKCMAPFIKEGVSMLKESSSPHDLPYFDISESLEFKQVAMFNEIQKSAANLSAKPPSFNSYSKVLLPLYASFCLVTGMKAGKNAQLICNLVFFVAQQSGTLEILGQLAKKLALKIDEPAIFNKVKEIALPPSPLRVNELVLSSDRYSTNCAIK